MDKPLWHDLKWSHFSASPFLFYFFYKGFDKTNDVTGVWNNWPHSGLALGLVKLCETICSVYKYLYIKEIKGSSVQNVNFGDKPNL